MPVWPKSIFTIGAKVLTSRTARRLRQKSAAIPAQRRILPGLLARLSTASFWKSSGVEAQMTPEQFRAKIPLRKYDDLAPAIQRMKAGAAGVLWPGQCVFFAETSGTTANGKTSGNKCLPVTDAMLQHFRQAGMDSLLYYTARVGNASVFRGRHLFLSGSTALQPIAGAKPLPAFTGELCGIAERNLSPAFEKHLYEPGREIAQLADWKAKLNAIVTRHRNCDVTLLGGMPPWIINFAAALRERPGEAPPIPNLQEIWPHLECLVHSGTSVSPFVDELRQVLGPQVNFHEVYLATEALIAVQDGEARAGLRLMADAGIYYEFVPIEDFDESRLATLGPKAIPLEDVRVGVDYALIVTTPAGLCRYALGDVVRFLSTEPPRLQWVGRAAHQLVSFGERILEKEISDALVTICVRNGWNIVHFHVAPLFTNPLLGTTRGRHEWWVELKPGTVITPTGPQMAIELDIELRRTNPSYDARRKANLEPPIVRLVMPGLFENWMKRNGKWGGQHKLLRCRNDRSIADGLAEIAQFAKD